MPILGPALGVAAATEGARLYQPIAPLLVVGIVAAGCWLVAVVVLTVRRWPERPDAFPATMELGDEPPAVVQLVTERFDVGPLAVPATLIDLAARRLIDIEQVQPGRYVCRVRTRTRDEEAAAPYERQVLDLLRSRAVDGVVPAGALTTGPGDASRGWTSRFHKAVVADAKARGLCRDMWDQRTLGILFVAGLAVAGLVYAAIGLHGEDKVVTTGLLQAAWIAVAVVAVTFFAVLSNAGKQRDTPAGHRAGSHWLGVRAQLDGGNFADLGPDAVSVWDRYLAYAAAMGVAVAAVRALPMGAEHDRRAWSSFGGRWHQVRVRYPRLRPGWGRHPAFALLHALIGIGVAGGYIVVASRLGRIEPTTLLPGDDAARLDLLRRAVMVAVTPLLAWCTVELACALIDVVAKVRVQGEVVRVRRRWAHPFWFRGDHDARYRWYVALDDGSTSVVPAWSVSFGVASVFDQGERFEVVLTRCLRHVRAYGNAPSDAPGAQTPAGVAEQLT